MNAMTVAIGLEQIVSGEGWYPDFFDERAVRYVRAARDEIASAPFLDPRFTGERQAMAAPVADVRAVVARLSAPADPAFIFHTAYCSSTLLCRALDAPGRARALKEPFLLMREANEMRRGGALDLSLACRLLAHAGAGERAIVKPSNAANNLAPALMAATSHARALVLHTDLRAFLLAIMTCREDRRAFARNLFRTLGDGHHFVRQFTPHDLLGLPDLKIAAFSWRLQVEPLFEAARRFPHRVASLHADRLHDDRAGVLRAVADWFELEIDDAELGAICAGPLFTEHAKDAGRAYDPTAQSDERRRIEEMFGWEIDAVCEWAKKLPFGGGDDGAFPNPLSV